MSGGILFNSGFKNSHTCLNQLSIDLDIQPRDINRHENSDSDIMKRSIFWSKGALPFGTKLKPKL